MAITHQAIATVVQHVSVCLLAGQNIVAVAESACMADLCYLREGPMPRRITLTLF